MKIFIIYIIIFIFVFPACVSTYERYITQTKRSGIEQLLVSRAMDNALKEANLNVDEAKIFIDIASLAKEDEPYVKKALTHWFLKKGAVIKEDKNAADYIASVLVKSSGTDGSQFHFGLPPLPIPLAAASTPRIDIIGLDTQKGYAKVEILLYSSNGILKEKTSSLEGKSYFKRFEIIFVPITREDIY